MARGQSGRIVVEVDPRLKLELYTALTARGLTLKAWFLEEAERFLEAQRQPSLFTRDSTRKERQRGSLES